MSAATKKPSSGSPGGRKPSTDPAMSSPSQGSTRTPITPSSSTNGVARSRSIRGGTPMSARAATQRPGAGASNLSTSSATSETNDDARAESAAKIEDLKEQLLKAENVSEHHQKQKEVLQSRLDGAYQEQVKLEERLHQSEGKLETLVSDKRDALRQRREMESIYEAERMAMTKGREEMANREEEMQAIIQRLKESLSQRSNTDDDRISRRSNNASPTLESGHFAPPSGLARSDSRSNSKLLLQKDKLIESLRLEVAETQIKLVEVENRGGGRLQEVERHLVEARMANARLMEDNESYQLLLQEKTMNGEFGKEQLGYMGSANTDALNALEGRAPTSLADELSQSEDNFHEISPEGYKRLESELKAAKDQNKALTLYINKIIERLLQHSDFEAILDQSSDFKPGASSISNFDKDLPPPPPPKDTIGSQSIFQRAATAALTSVTGTSSPGKLSRPRPQSQFTHPISTTTAQSVTTDPDTAPSIPFGAFGLARTSSLRQGSGRPKSEQLTGRAGAASVVNQMYKGGSTSPPLYGHGPQTPRSSQSFFAPGPLPAPPAGGKRVPSASSGLGSTGTFPGGVRSETSSISEETTSVQGSPRTTGTSGSIGSGEERGARAREREGMASFKGGQVRPLRLVRDREESEREKGKEDGKAKRGSWMTASMGWAWGGGGTKGDGGEETIRE